MNTGFEELAGRSDALADAFSAFVNAAGRLEHSYASLQAEVTQLRQQLQARDEQLASSLEENKRVRHALHSIVEALPCGVVVLDDRNQVVLSNPEAHRLLKQLSADLVQKMVRPAAAEADSDSEGELGIDESDGRRWLAVRQRKLHIAGLNPESTGTTGVVLIARDITAHKENERHREQTRNMVAMAEVATVLAHELRNPLGSMELLTGLLAQSDGLNEEAQGWVENIRAGVRLLAGTVNNILSFHTLGSPELVPVNLQELLSSSIRFVQPVGQQSEIRTTVEIDMADVQIAADANSFRQVVLNLACNAYKFTPPGGELKISARMNGGNNPVAVIEFADSGPGIAPEHLERIFDAGFTTGHSAGLGLAICKRIVEQHRGRISVTSEPGKGTTFHMEFPIV